AGGPPPPACCPPRRGPGAWPTCRWRWSAACGPCPVPGSWSGRWRLWRRPGGGACRPVGPGGRRGPGWGAPCPSTRVGGQAVATLVADTIPAEPGRTLLAEVAAAGGNPLFVTELLGGLLAEGAVQTAEGRREGG